MSVNQSERIGVFGGSFDPVHIGHLTIAQDAIGQLQLDRLVFVPASVPPHKQTRNLADGIHRFQMLCAAVGSHPEFEVSDIELKRGGISYTFDTMRQIQADHPGSSLFFIIGIDSLTILHSWKRVDELLDLCTVVPFARGGENIEQIDRQVQLPDSLKKQLMGRLIHIHEVEASSSEIRRRIAEGLSIHRLVPPDVERYIAEHHLYK